MTFPLDAAARASRRAAINRAYERASDAALQSTLAEELERDMSCIILPPDQISPAPRREAARAPVSGETAARIAFGFDDDPPAIDQAWKAKLAAGVLLLVLGVPTLLGCAALLIALAKWDPASDKSGATSTSPPAGEDRAAPAGVAGRPAALGEG